MGGWAGWVGAGWGCWGQAKASNKSERRVGCLLRIDVGAPHRAVDAVAQMLLLRLRAGLLSHSRRVVEPLHQRRHGITPRLDRPQHTERCAGCRRVDCHKR